MASIGADARVSIVIPEPERQAVIVNSPVVNDVMLNYTDPQVIESMSGGVPIYAPFEIIRYTFNAALVWVVQHNKNTDVFQESLVTLDGERFFAKRKLIDLNSFMIVLSSATSGYVDVIFQSATKTN